MTEGEATTGVTDDACKSFVAAYLSAMNKGQKREADDAFAEIAKAVEPIIAAIARRWPRREIDDIRQIALIGLLPALPNYDSSRPFLAFANIIIRNRIITAFIGEKSQKRQGTTVSIDAPHGDGDVSLANLLTVDDVMEAIERRDEVKTLLDRLNPSLFTEIEWRSSQLVYIEGLSYDQAAARMKSQYGVDTNEKAVDNAIVRFRVKAKAILTGASAPQRHSSTGHKFISRIDDKYYVSIMNKQFRLRKRVSTLDKAIKARDDFFRFSQMEWLTSQHVFIDESRFRRKVRVLPPDDVRSRRIIVKGKLRSSVNR